MCDSSSAVSTIRIDNWPYDNSNPAKQSNVTFYEKKYAVQLLDPYSERKAGPTQTKEWINAAWTEKFAVNFNVSRPSVFTGKKSGFSIHLQGNMERWTLITRLLKDNFKRWNLLSPATCAQNSCMYTSLCSTRIVSLRRLFPERHFL